MRKPNALASGRAANQSNAAQPAAMAVGSQNALTLHGAAVWPSAHTTAVMNAMLGRDASSLTSGSGGCGCAFGDFALEWLTNQLLVTHSGLINKRGHNDRGLLDVILLNALVYVHA